eukprot:gene29585-35714_t
MREAPEAQAPYPSERSEDDNEARNAEPVTEGYSGFFQLWLILLDELRQFPFL